MSTEKETQRSIQMWLSAKRYFYWRQNSGAFKTERGGFYYMGSPGAPDIFVVLPPEGKLVGIEVKDLKGKLNENQVVFKANLEKTGGVYLVARSLDDVIKFFGG